MRELRLAKGWSQQEAADLAGVRREMWAKYEAGAEPGARALAALAEAGIDALYVLTGRRSEPLEDGFAGRLAGLRKATDEAVKIGGGHELVEAIYVSSEMSNRVRALVDNYLSSDEVGKKALEQTSTALAKPAKRKAG